VFGNSGVLQGIGEGKAYVDMSTVDLETITDVCEVLLIHLCPLCMFVFGVFNLISKCMVCQVPRIHIDVIASQELYSLTVSQLTD
jgi:hypothetical protein